MNNKALTRACETGFAFCLGKTKLAVGTEFWLWMSGFGLLYVLAGVFP